MKPLISSQKPVPVWRSALEDPPPDFGNRATRRKVARQRRRQTSAIQIIRPMTEADIPPGSVLSERTLEEIRAGGLVLATARSSPTNSRRSSRRKRQRSR